MSKREWKLYLNDIPWRDMVDFRNRTIHEYFGISLEIVWKIITEDLPRLKEQIKRIEG